MPTLDDIVAHGKSTGLVTDQPKAAPAPADPAYDDWLRGIAEGYANNRWQEMSLAGPGTDEQSIQNMMQTLRENKGLTSIYHEGVSADSIVNAPLANSGSFDAGGFGVFGGKPYEELTAAQKKSVDAGQYTWTYNPTMGGGGSEGGTDGGYYWASNEKTPKVLGQYGTGQFTQFNPFNASQWNNSGSIAFDPSYGLVSLSSNRSAGAMDEAIYQAGPMIAMMIMTAGAGTAAMAGGGGAAASGVGSLTESQLGSMLLKVPSMAEGFGNGGGVSAGSLASILSQVFGVPGSSLIGGGINAVTSGGRNSGSFISSLISAALSQGGQGPKP